LASILKNLDGLQQLLVDEMAHCISFFQDTLQSASDHEHSSHMKNNCVFYETSYHYSIDLDRSLAQLLREVKYADSYLYGYGKTPFLEELYANI